MKAQVGFAGSEDAPVASLAVLALLHPTEVMVVDDAALDERVQNELCLAETPHVRFYAAAPLRLSSGQAIGALCVMDTKPRKIAPASSSN